MKAGEQEGGAMSKKEFQKANKDQATALDNFSTSVSITNEDVRLYYRVGATIGEGQFDSIIKIGYLMTDQKKKFLIKTVKKDKQKKDMKLMRNELNMLRNLEHPNIAQFYEVYGDANSFYYILEYCEGRDLTTYIEEEAFSEKRTREIVFQMLLILNYLHHHQVIHRDIKPDHFMYKKEGGYTVKLIDLSLAYRLAQDETELKGSVGTPQYAAPELVADERYDSKVDIWATGVSMYLMLGRCFPFQGATNTELFEAIQKQGYTLHQKNLKVLSDQGVQLLAKLLDKNPKNRYSAAQAINDPWFDKIRDGQNMEGRNFISQEMLTRLRLYRKESRLCKEVIRMMVMLFDTDPEVVKLRKAFFYLDMMDMGVINAKELVKAFGEIGERLSQEEAKELIESVAWRSKSGINYIEFVMATVGPQFFTTPEYVKEVFTRFDVNHDGFITPQEMEKTMSKLGIDLTSREIKKMMKEADENSDQLITLEELTEALKQLPVVL